jgi:spermidine/putrescine transport system permease protein
VAIGQQGSVGGARPARSGDARPRKPQRQPRLLFWAALAAPGIAWLVLLFIVPFYAVLAIAAGQLDQLFGTPIAAWNPLHWSTTNLVGAWHDIVGPTSFVGPIMVRTVFYVGVASVLSLLIGYPAAYFVARFAGRRKGSS